MERSSQVPTRLPFEEVAKKLNREAGLYLSEAQQRGLAAALFAGTILIAAGITWSIGRTYRRHLR